MAGETLLTVVGNLTRDPELRFTPSGAAVCKFSVASTPRTMDRQSNEWKDGEPLFLDCTAWRDLAEHVAETLERGMRVIVTGRLKAETWEDKNGGGKRSRFVLEVEEVGPSLKFATATVAKAGGTGGGGFGDRQPASAPAGRGSSSFDDEPPF